jgi:hypothetical protein
MSRISLRKSINAHCKDCIYDNLAPGSWRQQVALCPIDSCALYKVRPMPTSGPLCPNNDTDERFPSESIVNPDIILKTVHNDIINEQSGHDSD